MSVLSGCQYNVCMQVYFGYIDVTLKWPTLINLNDKLNDHMHSNSLMMMNTGVSDLLIQNIQCICVWQMNTWAPAMYSVDCIIQTNRLGYCLYNHYSIVVILVTPFTRYWAILTRKPSVDYSVPSVTIGDNILKIKIIFKCMCCRLRTEKKTKSFDMTKYGIGIQYIA